MPVSFAPVFVAVALVGVPVVLWVARGYRTGLVASTVSALCLGCFLLSVFAPAWLLEAKAKRGDPGAQYRLAKWHCTHRARISAVVYWPFRYDPLGGYRWLESAAAQEYPPALYALGVCLKQGVGVPRPPNWNGPAGRARQPEQGQVYIDKAIEMGYVPVVKEEAFIWHVFCGDYVRDPYG